MFECVGKPFSENGRCRSLGAAGESLPPKAIRIFEPRSVRAPNLAQTLPRNERQTSVTKEVQIKNFLIAIERRPGTGCVAPSLTVKIV